MIRTKQIAKSSYRSVTYILTSGGQKKWAAKGAVRGQNFFSMHDTEREAAVAVDKFRVQLGVKPVNILVSK